MTDLDTRTLAALMATTGDVADLIGRPAWHAQAACRTAERNTFYPAPTDEEGNAAAKAICARCSVRTTCLEQNIDEPHGVWGGMTEHERAAAIRTEGGRVLVRRSRTIGANTRAVLKRIADDGGTYHGSGAQLLRDALGPRHTAGNSAMTKIARRGYVTTTTDGTHIVAVTLTDAGREWLKK